MTNTVHQRVGILVGGNQIIQGNAAFHTLVQSVGTNVAHIRVTTREDHGVATVRIEFFKANHAVERKGGRHGNDGDRPINEYSFVCLLVFLVIKFPPRQQTTKDEKTQPRKRGIERNWRKLFRCVITPFLSGPYKKKDALSSFSLSPFSLA
jgi:hypothetical protein